MKLQIDFGEASTRELLKAASNNSEPVSHLIQRALNLDDYLSKQIGAGHQVIIQAADGSEADITKALQVLGQ